MLTSLRPTATRRPGDDEGGDVIDLMLDCHARIRRFSELSVRLATENAPAAELADAAAQVFRYFSIALPLHVADEDEMLMPRLLKVPPSLEVGRALATMARQHRMIHALLDEMLAHWTEVAAEPSRVRPLRETLVEGSATLAGLFDEHLALEETTIFPAARALLSPKDRQAMARELRERRTSRPGGV